MTTVSDGRERLSLRRVGARDTGHAQALGRDCDPCALALCSRFSGRAAHAPLYAPARSGQDYLDRDARFPAAVWGGRASGWQRQSAPTRASSEPGSRFGTKRKPAIIRTCSFGTNRCPRRCRDQASTAPSLCGALKICSFTGTAVDGRYWARTSDLLLVSPPAGLTRSTGAAGRKGFEQVAGGYAAAVTPASMPPGATWTGWG